MQALRMLVPLPLLMRPIGQKAKHDHRRSLWGIAGGAILWCYRCGAWRLNESGTHGWHKPTGANGSNPAMRKGYRI